MSKGRDAFRTISEVADELELPQHVLRFWETKFSQIKPMKRGGNRRYYRPDDIRLLSAIRQLLHEDGFTIRGVQKLFKEQGVKTVVQNCHDGIKPGGIQASEAANAAPETDEEPVAEVAPDAAPVSEKPAARDQGTVDLENVRDQLVSLRRMLAGS